MGKKANKRSKYISKGERRSIAKVAVERTAWQKEMDILTAWRKGRNPWVTIPNPAKGTNQPFIKVRANNYWGSPKNLFPNIFGARATNKRAMNA